MFLKSSLAGRPGHHHGAQKGDRAGLEDGRGVPDGFKETFGAPTRRDHVAGPLYGHVGINIYIHIQIHIFIYRYTCIDVFMFREHLKYCSTYVYQSIYLSTYLSMYLSKTLSICVYLHV